MKHKRNRSQSYRDDLSRMMKNHRWKEPETTALKPLLAVPPVLPEYRYNMDFITDLLKESQDKSLLIVTPEPHYFDSLLHLVPKSAERLILIPFHDEKTIILVGDRHESPLSQLSLNDMIMEWVKTQDKPDSLDIS